MSQGWDVLEAAVGEGSPFVALGRVHPPKNLAQPVVVVVLREASQGSFSLRQAGEAFPIQDFGLQDVPEGFDLAVRPRRGDLGAEMPDVEFGQALAEAGEETGHPAHEGFAVVAHQLQRLPAELEALVQPAHDGHGLGFREDAQSHQKSGVVVNEPDDPGLDVVATTEIDEEGALDVDVPELVGTAALVTRSRGPGGGASATAPVLEQLIDVIWADLVDLAPVHLRSDPLGVPVSVQADGDDDHVNPGGDGLAQALRLSRSLPRSCFPPTSRPRLLMRALVVPTSG